MVVLWQARQVGIRIIYLVCVNCLISSVIGQYHMRLMGYAEYEGQGGIRGKVTKYGKGTEVVTCRE